MVNFHCMVNRWDTLEVTAEDEALQLVMRRKRAGMDEKTISVFLPVEDAFQVAVAIMDEANKWQANKEQRG